MYTAKFFTVVILLFILKASHCIAADTTLVARYQIIFDLEDYWQVYDADYQAYVPYVKETHGNPYALHFDLDLSNYKGYNLLIQTPQPVYLFIQAQLYKRLSAGDKIVLNIDSLQRVHSQHRLLFSLYNNDRHSILPSASVIYNPKVSLSSETPAALLTPLKQRANSNLADFLIIAAVLILALYAFLWNYYPKAFSSYYNLGSVFSFSIKEDTVLISRPLSRLNMMFILNHSFLLSFLYILIQKSSGRLIVNDQFLQSFNTFGELFLYFIVLGVLIFILLIGKYFFILFLGSLFNLSKVIHIHFYEYLLFSRIFYSVVVPVIFFIFITYPSFIPLAIEELILVIIIFNFIRVMIINFALNKLTSVKNLYLFSYLCATELIPLLIGIKVLVE